MTIELDLIKTELDEYVASTDSMTQELALELMRISEMRAQRNIMGRGS